MTNTNKEIGKAFVILHGPRNNILACANCAVASSAAIVDDFDGDAECELCPTMDYKPNKYFIFMLPSNMPLNLTPLTLEEANRAIRWQLVGQSKREDFALVIYNKNAFRSVDPIYKPGEVVEPSQGVYTLAAWEEFHAQKRQGFPIQPPYDLTKA